MDITSGSCLPSTASMLHITCRGGGMAALGRAEGALGRIERGLGRTKGERKEKVQQANRLSIESLVWPSATVLPRVQG